MNKILLLFFTWIFGAAHLNGEDPLHAEDITYDWLADFGSTSGYTDHVVIFQRIFSKMKVKTFLEFGLGFSTKYFLDSCNKVISVEFVTNGSGPDWFKKCVNLYQEYSNWIPIVYFSGYPGDTHWVTYKYLGSDNVYKAASYQCSTHKHYAAVDNFYLTELNMFISNLSKSRSIDIAFVDAGIYLRGDLVQLLFDKAPIILAHDTTVRAIGELDDVYGYCRIAPPDYYEEIYFPQGCGTTAWILKKEQFQELIDDLKRYAQGLYTERDSEIGISAVPKLSRLGDRKSPNIRNMGVTCDRLT